MHKTLLKVGLAAAMAAAMPMLALAANDVTLTTDAVINVAGVNLNVSGSSATISSITVNASNFTFALDANSTIQITSNDRRVLTTDAPTSIITTNTCTNGNSTLKHSTLSGSYTVTVTPQSYTCGGSATNSGYASVAGSGGGGGGGGGGGYSGVSAVTPNTIVYSVPSCPTGYTCKPAAGTVPAMVADTTAASAPKAVAVAGVSAVFSRTLDVGSASNDVRRLQQLLASDKSVYPEGRVTGTFGPLTQKAVQAFQVKYGIAKEGDSGYGVVGPKTRAQLQKVFGK